MGLIYLIGTIATPPRRARGIALMVLAMAFHGTWDAAAAIAGEAGINAILVMLAAVVIEVAAIIILVRRTSRGERVWMLDLMTPEVERGTITADELTALAGTRKDRKHYYKSVKAQAGKKTAQHILDAANDLAEAISTSGGADTPAVLHARSEVARVRAAA